MNNIDSWKNSGVFDMQLSLNLKELSDSRSYPSHWLDILELIKANDPKSLLDVGCGCGAFFEVCRIELPNISYFGTDYAEEAISLAVRTWGGHFKVLDYLELTSSYLEGFDLVNMGALLDVLPNGDEALEFVLSLSPKSMLISRVKFTDSPSYSETYVVYNGITTYAYYHNRNNFLSLCSKYGYEIDNINNNFYLNKKK